MIAIDKWVIPFYPTNMTTKLTLDKAGRVVIPKPLRDELRLSPGDALHLEADGERITLHPVRPRPPLQKEHGIWVYRSGQPSNASITELIDKEREKRIRDLMR